MSEAPFTRVGVRPIPPPRLKTRPWYEGRPVLSCAILAVILLGCLFCGAFIPKDPAYMDLPRQHAARRRILAGDGRHGP